MKGWNLSKNTKIATSRGIQRATTTDLAPHTYIPPQSWDGYNLPSAILEKIRCAKEALDAANREAEEWYRSHNNHRSMYVGRR